MTNISRMRVALTGFIGGPGVCTFYSTDPSSTYPQLVDLWGSLSARMPSTVSISVEATGDVIDPATGVLVDSWSHAAAAGFAGADPAVYPAPAGACLTWICSDIFDGKRLKGRTYVVPMGGGAYQADGTINPANLTALRSAASDYVTACTGFAVVWHRPRVARDADGSRPAVTARAGSFGIITSSTVHDQAVVLRSRR